MKDIEKIQKILMSGLDKLNDEKYMKENLKNEISRNKAITTTSLTYIKAKNLELKIKGFSAKGKKKNKKINE